MKINLNQAAAFLIAWLIAAGFWLGAYTWFGGYTSTREFFGWLAIAATVVVVVLRWRASPERWPWHIGYAVVAQTVFVMAVAVGQVHYAGPANSAEFFSDLGRAIRGEL